MIALRIVTPKGNYASLNVKSIHIKSVEGEMTILSNHIPIFASIVPCELVLECEDGNKMNMHCLVDFSILKTMKHFY